jgi:hypothetical protein
MATLTGAILTACGGGDATPSASAIAAVRGVQPPQNVRPAKKSDLLYISDNSTADVYVYTYPQLTLTQTLTGFGAPNGLCTDKKGDVFVADYYDEDVVEYAHGGSTPIATISDADHNPGGCAIDPKNGDLVVSNLKNTTTTGAHGPATVSIFKPNFTTFTVISDADFSAFWYCGYDSHGNLFVDGYSKNGTKAQLAELPSGSSTFTNLKLSETPLSPGGVQWAGKYLVMSDQNSTIYQFAISGNDATEHGTTSLTDAEGIYEFFISGSDIASTSSETGSFGIWKYPAGGSPVKTVSGLVTPLGLTISRAK